MGERGCLRFKVTVRLPPDAPRSPMRAEGCRRGSPACQPANTHCHSAHLCCTEMWSTLGMWGTCPDLETSFRIRATCPHDNSIDMVSTVPRKEILPSLRSHSIWEKPKAPPSGVYNSFQSKSTLPVWDHFCQKQCCLVTQVASFLSRLLGDYS